MSLTKDAVLNLRTTGFDVAEVNGNRIARFLEAGERATKTLGATAGRIGPALAPAGTAAHRIAEQLGIADTKARGAALSFTAMERALTSVTAKGDLAQTFGGLDKLKAAATRVRLAGPETAGPSTVTGAAMRLRAMRESGRATTAGAALANPSGLTGLGGALTRIAGPAAAAAGAVYAVQSAGDALFRTIGRGEKVAQIATGFETLTQKVGGSAAVMESLERATGGGVAQTDLMTAANRLLVADLGLSRERMEKLAEAGVRLGKVQGITATDAVERMSLALAKQEPELLDELGLKVDLTKAIHEYAAAAKIDVAAVDAQTRGRIFLEAVEKQALDRAGKLGASVTAQAAATEAMSKKWADFQDRMARFVEAQPGFASALRSTADAAASVARGLEPIIALAGKAATALSFVVDAYRKVYETVPGLGLAVAGGVAGPIGSAVAVASGGMGGAGGSGGGPSSPAARSAPIDLSPATINALARALRGESPFANAFGGG